MAVYLGISITPNSQSIANNTSNVTVKVNCSWVGGSYNKQTINGVPQAGGWVIIDGTYYYFNNTFNDNRTSSGSKTLYTKTLDIPHDIEGKKTLVCSAQFNTHISSGTISASNSLKLTDIPRFATIVSAPNFNDEQKPTITYSNPAGANVTSIQAAIVLDGSNPNIDASVAVAYRNIPVNGTSYTFNDITSAELDSILYATTGSNTRKVWFKIKTVIGSNTGYSQVERTFTVVNPNPVINPVITDTNSVTNGLTGNSSKLVRYYSNAKVAIAAYAVKRATLTEQKVTCGGSTLTADGTITGVTTNNFVFTAKDNRGNTTTKTVTPSFVEYVKLTCSLNNNMPGADGKMTVKATGNYYNGSFGAKSNSLNVYYRYKTVGGSYNNWSAMTVTKSGNTYSATANLTGLDYQTAYGFQAYAVDALATVYSLEKTVKATPIFDWGENDFNFNVPVDVKESLTASSLMLKKKTITVGGDLDTYYPVHIYTINSEATPQFLFLRKALGTPSPAWNGNHSNGTSSVVAGWMYRAMGWDGNGRYCTTLHKHEPYAKLISQISVGNNAAYGVVLWLRGGGAEYQLSSNLPFEANIYLETINLSTAAYPYEVAPYTSIKNGGILYSGMPSNIDAMYPIDSIYISYDNASPASKIGGTWTRVHNPNTNSGVFLFGATSDKTMGAFGGEENVTLTVNQMPKHSHSMPFAGATAGYQSPYPYYVKSGSTGNDCSGRGWMDNLGTFEVGGGTAHNNMPPYINVAIWRRTG